ncbi:hypothetical protein BpHYR1_045401 [Brachionus plicatilis]|uniref:Uncharacterized protein n=1 Tax=Brachionus plicatilis TaxID=10195 RepID=A0A3M7SLX0_BRAPC|nr:hypothetical protein BpHYR1_045401 [Brachionus plicatilis]
MTKIVGETLTFHHADKALDAGIYKWTIVWHIVHIRKYTFACLFLGATIKLQALNYSFSSYDSIIDN